MPTDFNGLLVIDKPPGITSRTAVDRAQRWFPRGTRIGHTGTLDPLATGILVLCIGNATRLTEYVHDLEKVYHAGIMLGATSDTDDADGAITPTPNAVLPERTRIEQELSGFLGQIEQVPPAYSAAKVSGRRAYALARKGQAVSLTARTVTIHRIDIVRYDYPLLELVVRCAKGTYIRSLARDLGQRLGCGGYIQTLRRTEIGWFKEAHAIALDLDADSARARLLPTWRALQDWSPILISDDEALKLRQGQRIPCREGFRDDLERFAVMDRSEGTLAIVKPEDGCLRPLKVLYDVD
jgi:tRNA pseudouridine55 synthase